MRQYALFHRNYRQNTCINLYLDQTVLAEDTNQPVKLYELLTTDVVDCHSLADAILHIIHEHRIFVVLQRHVQNGQI